MAATEINRVGLIGWPVGHSISPAMHNAAFGARGLNWTYTAHAVPPDSLENEVRRLFEQEGYRGLNVTVPHKQAVLALATEISLEAQAIGAANTLIVLPDGGLRADNTDWQGFTNDLKMMKVTVEGAACLILGTGGSARGIAYALEHSGAASITFVSRDPAGKPGVIRYDDLPDLAPGAGLIVNCTPLGMSPGVDASPWPAGVPFPPGAVLYDLIYNPTVTRLMSQARAAGARIVGGLGMLVWQGAYSFERWTHQPPPVDIMFAAAKRALTGDNRKWPHL